MRTFLDGVTVDVNQLAQQLAKIAGPVAQKSWEAYVRQQYVEGWQNVFAALIFGVILFGLVVWGSKLVSWAKNYEYGDFSVFGPRDAGMPNVLVVLPFILAGFALIFALLNMSWAFAHFYNPGYGAIQDVLGR